MERSDVEIATEIINLLYEGAQSGLDDSYNEDIVNLGKLLKAKDGKTVAAILVDTDLLEKYNFINPQVENQLSELVQKSKEDSALLAVLKDCQVAIFSLDKNIADNKNLPGSEDAARRLMSKLVEDLYESVQNKHTGFGVRALDLAKLIDRYQGVFLDEANIEMLIKFNEVYSNIADAYFNQFKDTEEYNPELFYTITGISQPVSSIVDDFQRQQESILLQQQTRIMVQTAKDQYANETPLNEDFYEQVIELANNYAQSLKMGSVGDRKSFEPTIIAIMKEVGQHPNTDPSETLTNLLAAIEQRNGETMVYVNEKPSRIDTRVHPISLNEMAQFANSHDDVSLLDAVYLQARADDVIYQVRIQSTTQERMQSKLDEIKHDFPNTPLGVVIQEKIDGAARAYPEKQRQQEQQRRAEQTFGHASGFDGQERTRNRSGPKQEWTNTKREASKEEIKNACEILKINLENTHINDVETVIKNAYNKQSLSTHPDKIKPEEKSPEKIKESQQAFIGVKDAYKLLKDKLMTLRKWHHRKRQWHHRKIRSVQKNNKSTLALSFMRGFPEGMPSLKQIISQNHRLKVWQFFLNFWCCEKLMVAL